MRTLYFDCFSGASGDMIVGALIDVGADFGAIRQGLESLGVEGYGLSAETIVKKGVKATQFKVILDPGTKQPHRHLHHVLEIIEAGNLPAPVKAASAETFRRIAECEADVHGTTVEKVHFHEVGAVDSIVDVVGAHLALHLLHVDRVCASALAVGSGIVQCAHGVLPVPAPATALLLRGVPAYGGGVETELVTPTGAALITQFTQTFGPMPLMQAERIGYGAGTREIADRPNVLRVTLGETADSEEMEPVTVIDCNVDDMVPELLAALIGELIEAGARDAYITPMTGKKGRPGHVITVLCDAAKAQTVSEALFAGSTTLGVRMRTDQRICLRREWKTVQTPWGGIRVKIGYRDGKPSVRAPEFEECRALAEMANVPVRAVYEAALGQAIREQWTP